MRVSSDELARDERVARLLRRPVRDPLVLPFSGVEARLYQSTPRAFVALAAVGVVVVALVAGTALAQRRSAVGEPSTVAGPPSASPLGWQSELMAAVRAAPATSFWPLIPTFLPDTLEVLVAPQSSCGTGASPCLDYRFYKKGTSDVVLMVLQGPAGCCLDGAHPNAIRDVQIRPGVFGQYDVVSSFRGLWWAEETSRGPVYVAIDSPILTEDELIRIASSMRPLPPR